MLPFLAKCKTFLSIKATALSAVIKEKAREDFFLVFMLYLTKFKA